MMNPVLEEILRTGLVKRPGGETLRIHSHISKEEGDFLQGIISEIKASVSLEVGLAYGISALFICEALQKGSETRHIVIDPGQLRESAQQSSWGGIGLNNLKNAGFGGIFEFHDRPSDLVLPQLVAKNVKVDFAFIDGWHTFDYTLVDFFYVDKLLRAGGVVAFDDADYPSVKKVCRYVLTNRSYSVFRCLQPATTLKRRVGRGLFRCAKYLPRVVQRALNPEWVQPCEDLGLVPSSRCVALRKESDYNNPFDFHCDF